MIAVNFIHKSNDVQISYIIFLLGGATLNFEVECLGISNKSPPTPNLFDEIDTDSSDTITREEITAWFKAKRGQEELPQGLWENEDKDKDGVISWDEFSGLIYFSCFYMYVYVRIKKIFVCT